MSFSDKLKIFQTPNAKGVVSLLAGSTLQKAIFALGGFILANLYGPENFGMYSVYTSYVGILSIIGTLRLEHILVISRDPKAIRNLFNALLIITAFAVYFFLFIFIAIKFLWDPGENSIPIWILILSGAGSIFTAWNFIQNALFTKYKLFKATSVGFIIMAVFSTIFQVLFYFIFPYEIGYYGYILGAIAGVMISFFYYLSLTKRRMKRIDIPLAKKTIFENKEILKYTFPSDLLSAFANNLFLILAAVYFSKLEIGVLGIAVKILITPLLMVSNSMSRVYFQKAAQMFSLRKHHVLGVTLKVVLYNSGLILIYLVFINTIGRYILDLFFAKNNWVGLNTYILLLSFWILARSTVTPITSIVMVIKKNQITLWMNALLLLVNFIAIYIGVYLNDFEPAIMAFSVLSGLIYLLFLLIILLNLKKIKTESLKNLELKD